MNSYGRRLRRLERSGGSRAAVWRESTRHDARRLVARYPSVYLPLARRKYPDAVLDADTQLVIDGFTRSAVTFAVVGFQMAQNGHVRVAHHLHAPAQPLAAARRGVPVLLSVRRPEDSILSALVREPFVRPGTLVRSYVEFYERLCDHRSSFVVATFEEITSDLGAVVRAVNERFGTDFRPFDQTDENVRRCFELIEERARRPSWEPLIGRFLSGRISLDEFIGATDEARGRERPPTLPEERVQRPSETRQAQKEARRSDYLQPRLASLRARAENAYATLLESPRAPAR